MSTRLHSSRSMAHFTFYLWEFPLEFCNGSGAQKKLEWCPTDCQKMWRYVHSFRHSTGIERTERRTDRIGKTILHSACIACWRVIKRWATNRTNKNFWRQTRKTLANKILVRMTCQAVLLADKSATWMAHNASVYTIVLITYYNMNYYIIDYSNVSSYRE